MAVYYHLSTNLNFDGYFYPRIPNHRHKDQEDTQTKRVCVAPTIEDCLTAIPNGGSHLEDLNIKQRGYYRVYVIDTAKLNIFDKDVISSDILYEKDLVRDADATNEVWITTSFDVAPEDSYIIKVDSWEETACDIYPYSFIEIADKEYDGDFEEAYFSIYNETIPWCAKIINLDYSTECLTEGDTIYLYFDKNEEKKQLKELIEKEPDTLQIKEEYIDEFILDIKSDINIAYLYEQHLSLTSL